jgi:hypothetical protein
VRGTADGLPKGYMKSGGTNDLMSDFSDAASPGGKPMPSGHSEEIQRDLWSFIEEKKDHHIFSILDTARNERIFPALLESSLEYRCLFLGDLPRVLASAAPHLVLLRQDSSFVKWLFRESRGDSWGIYLSSNWPLAALLTHFRDLITARTEDGKTYYFRFYDPRVLRIYMPTCNSEELKAFFGPVDSFFVENEDPSESLMFQLDNGILRQEKVRLRQP